MKVTFFGTTTLLFDDGKDQILFDAHFTRPSMTRYIFRKSRTDRQTEKQFFMETAQKVGARLIIPIH